MRTKNGKWTVSILALVPLLALAAFLAAGLLTANNAEALEDDECGFVIAENTGNIAASRGDTALTNTVPCNALGDSIDIIIENNHDEESSDARPVNVYVSGGSDYSKVQIAAAGDYTGAVGVAEYKLDVPQPDRRDVAGKATVTVSRSMGKSSGVVLVSIYDDDPDFTALKDLEAASTIIPNGATADATMVIVFLGKPSLTRIDTEECLDAQDPPQPITCTSSHDTNVDGHFDADTKPDPSSAVKAYEGGTVGAGFIANIATDEAIEIPTASTGEIHIFAEVRDDQGRALAGNDDSSITFTVEYAVGSALKSNAQLMYSDPEELDGDGRASIELEGWTTDDTDPIEVGPVKVTVTAMYSGPTGNLDLGKVELSRGSDATGIAGGIFSVGCLVDPDAGANAATEGYDNDMFVMKDNENCIGPIMAPRFGEGGAFVVKAHLEDKLGSVVTGDLDVGLDDSVTDPIDPDDNPDELNAHGVTDAKVWVYTVDKDAMLGDHMITLDSDEKDVDDLVLTVSVAGPPVEYMISGPDSIDLGGRATFTVTAMDANDGIPHFITMDDDDKNDTVEIVVPDIAESLVRGSELRNGILTLDSDTGMGTFTIYAPSNAPDGSTARIFVSAGDVEITHTVMFGMMGEMPPGMPMNVMAMATSDTMITVSWDAVMDATSYMVERGYMDADNMMMWMTVAEMTMDMMYMDSGLMADTTYYYRVTAMNDAGSGDASDGRAMATTEMTPVTTELTEPTDITVSSVRNTGTVSVTWTPGQNAAQNIAVLFNANVTGLGIDAGLATYGPTGAAHTFLNVPAGDYVVVVASFRAGEPHKFVGLHDVTVE